tara:strand:- start:472 stop:690 length:219 start_codon:yes stop_codon:yes gene_type:complete
MKYLCSNCSIILSKDDLRLSEEFAIGKLYCWDCLKKNIGKIPKTPNPINDQKLLKEVEEDLIAIAKELKENV